VKGVVDLFAVRNSGGPSIRPGAWTGTDFRSTPHGTMKLTEVKPIEATAIPQGDPSRKLLDVRAYKTAGGPQVFEKIRHELAMMPYISQFDFISFTMVGSEVILTGWTVRATNRSEAENRVKTPAGDAKGQ
jgi:hypothetical protein